MLLPDVEERNLKLLLTPSDFILGLSGYSRKSVSCAMCDQIICGDCRGK